MQSKTKTSLSIDGDSIVIFTHNDFNQKKVIEKVIEKVIASGSFEKLEQEIRSRTFHHIFVEGGDSTGRELASKIMKIKEKQSVSTSNK